MLDLAWAVGGLLYSPATNGDVARHILARDWPNLTAVSLCLEDAIQDEALPAAETQLRFTLQTLGASGAPLPLLFVRVRGPEHLRHVHAMLGACSSVLTGYILPKFDNGNARAYLDTLRDIQVAGKPLYAMPIIESRAIAHAATRREALRQLRDTVDSYRELILNIRVGGNDFCNLYGLRRQVTQTIYDVGVVRDILVDILNAFAEDYVVSGPVWEYYGTDPSAPWATGLVRELALDRANGFLGKTAIHPSQLPLIHRSLQVSRADYDDAMRILGWNDPLNAVQGSACGRMNEVKCHTRWAEGIARRAKIYGICEDAT